jgi:hypothetical protein
VEYFLDSLEATMQVKLFAGAFQDLGHCLNKLNERMIQKIHDVSFWFQTKVDDNEDDKPALSFEDEQQYAYMAFYVVLFQ